jgi:hypothetical protein
VRHKLFESRDVHLHRRRLQGNDRAVDQQNRGRLGGQGFSEGEQRLAQARPCLGFRQLAPQERGKLVPRVRLSRRQGEIGEEGMRLPRRQAEGRGLAAPRLEPSKQGQ